MDADGEPVESGWINVGNGTDSLTIQNCTIDDTGKAIFRWVNTTPSYYYNYTVYYQNNDYNPQLIKLAENIPIIEPHIPINVETNLTTVNFEVYTSGDVTPISGAKLILRKDIPGEPSIVNLTTDINGQATLRWINSSSFIPGQIVNYSLQVYFS